MQAMMFQKHEQQIEKKHKSLKTKGLGLLGQHFACMGSVLIGSLACFLASDAVNYKLVPLILLLVVSLLAMLFNILPVLIAAVSSAFIWNFFFIPPKYTFHITDAGDLLMFSLYFSIALINAVLTFKIRSAEREAREKKEREKTIKLYDTLLNSLSHELRTPIAAIICAVDSLKDNGELLSESQKNDLLQQIVVAGSRLDRQVGNLLNMSRLDSGQLKPNFDWCDVNELVTSTIQKLEPNLQAQIVFIADESLPLYKVDRGLMEQALQNLTINAFFHNQEHVSVGF